VTIPLKILLALNGPAGPVEVWIHKIQYKMVILKCSPPVRLRGGTLKPKCNIGENLDKKGQKS